MSTHRRQSSNPRCWGDPVLWIALGAIPILHVWICRELWGARIADTVEYLDRAMMLARGIELGGETTRSPLLSLLLVPLKRLMDGLGADSIREFVGVTRALSTLFAMGAMVALYRLGSHLASRAVARAAILLLAGSSTWIAWGPEPTSSHAAGFLLLLGAAQLTAARTAAGALGAAALLGAAAAFKYQLVLIAPFILLLPCPGAPTLRRRCALALAALLGFAATATLGDLLAYGSPGHTWPAYLRANVLPLVYSVLHPVTPEALRLELHQLFFDLPASSHVTAGLPLQRARPFLWYLQNPGEALPWPAIALLAAGATWSALGLRDRRVRRACAVLLALLVPNLLALSLKGAKEPRLLIPLLPFLALWIALMLRAPLARRAGAFALTPLLLLCAASPAWELARQSASGDLGRLKTHWSYAEAMRWLGRIGPAADRPPWEIVATYHFAVALEETSGLHVVKSPHDLDRYTRLGPEGRAAVSALFEPRSILHVTPPIGPGADRRQDLARRASHHLGGHGLRAVRGYDGHQVLECDAAHERLGELEEWLSDLGLEVRYRGVSSPEWFLTHSQTLESQPDLLRLIAEQFDLAAVFYDPLRATSSALHPLWALRRRGMEPSAVPLLQHLEGFRLDRYLESIATPLRIAFALAERPLFELLAVDIHPRFARDGHALVTFRWHCLNDLQGSNWIFAHRLTGPREPTPQIDAPPAYGALATDGWSRGDIVEETLLFPLPLEWAAGESSSAFEIWIGVYEGRPGGGPSPQPVQALGRRRSADGLIHVGGGIAGPRRDRSLPRLPSAW